MSCDEAREMLGLAPTSSFDQAMKARNKKLERFKDDAERSMQVGCRMQPATTFFARLHCRMCAMRRKPRRQMAGSAAAQIETAYDVLLMDNMKRRLSGEADVAKSVRFADVPRPKKKVQVGAGAPEQYGRCSVQVFRHVKLQGRCSRNAALQMQTGFLFADADNLTAAGAAAQAPRWAHDCAAAQPDAGHAIGGVWLASRVDACTGAEANSVWH